MDDKVDKKSPMTTEINTAHSQELVQKHNHVTSCCMAYYLISSYGIVQHITAGDLQYHQVCARWEPCVNRQHTGQNDGLSNFPEQQTELFLAMGQATVISFPSVSNQPFSGNTLAHSVSRKKC
jgi:hypothetical protein